MIRLIIADDHQTMTDGLQSILEKEDDIEIIGVVHNGKAALELLEKSMKNNVVIDMAILDMDMPEMDGAAVTEHILNEYPDTKVLILSMYKDYARVDQVISLGALGYLLKEESTDELVKAIRYILDHDKLYASLEVYNLLIKGDRESRQQKEQDVVFTPKEIQVLQEIAEGLDNKEMAYKLKITENTLKTHIKNLKVKADISSPKKLIKYAIENGFAKKDKL